jgi:hypothetical protein
MVLGKLDTSKEDKLDLCHLLCIKISSKWTKDLNEELKLWNYYSKTWGKSWRHRHWQKFSELNSNCSGNKSKNLQTGMYQLTCFCTSKVSMTQFKNQTTECEKIFSSYSMNRGLICRIYKVLKNKHQSKNNPFNKWAYELSRQFP